MQFEAKDKHGHIHNKFEVVDESVFKTLISNMEYEGVIHFTKPKKFGTQ